MFQSLKNIDTAFRFVRIFCLVFITCTTIICLFFIHHVRSILQNNLNRVHVLADGKLLDADGIERKDSVLAVEMRDHLKMFHIAFYTLEPDEAANTRHITEALYLADNSALMEYNNLKENGYYDWVRSANISQVVLRYDSIRVDMRTDPARFRYYGKLLIKRARSKITRSLITEGTIRVLPGGITDNNPHGMQIEQYKVNENKDLLVEKNN